MYIKDTYRKFGGNFSVTHKVFDNLSVKAYANIMHSKRNYNSDLSYSRNPIFPVYDDKGIIGNIVKLIITILWLSLI